MGTGINAEYILIHKTSSNKAKNQKTGNSCTDAYDYVATKIDIGQDYDYSKNIQKLIASTGGVVCHYQAAKALKEHYQVFYY